MEDFEPILIPTRFKGKISHELSFPVGAEKLSNALAHSPQYSRLVLHFHSDFRRRVRLGCYPCIGVMRASRYADMKNEFLDAAGIPLFNEWQLDVYPVPRIHRHLIQQHIINRALPEISEWLRKRDEIEHSGEESLKFFFDEEKDEFTPELQTRLQPQRAR
jgi:hypothetical protein